MAATLLKTIARFFGLLMTSILVLGGWNLHGHRGARLRSALSLELADKHHPQS
jgi:hypothetical protein